MLPLLLLLPCAYSQPTDLRVEYLTSPLAVDRASPRFSWRSPGAQWGWRILASLSPDLSTALWDSGEVLSPSPSQHAYLGPPLPADTDIYWTVATSPSPTAPYTNSTPSRFTMGLLAPSDWQGARWIGGFNQLRRNFSLPSAPARARAYVTGVGCYELFVNGARVAADGEGRETLINPGFSTIYSSRVLYNAYNVAPLLTAGENVLGLRLGMCKWGYLGEFCTAGPTACNSGLLLLSLGGGAPAVATDGAWVGAQSPILSDHLYNGETYDGRVEAAQAGWSAPGFDAAAWAPAAVRAASPTAALSAHSMPQIVHYLPPARAAALLPVSPTSATFDLGVNGAGRCTLTLPAPLPPAHAVTLLHAEILRANNSVDVSFACPSACCADGGNCANQSFTYITRGGAVAETYRPTFAYSGMRYIQVLNWPPPPTPAPTLDALECVQTSTGVEAAGGIAFNSSTPTGATLNAIQGLILRSQRSNLHSIPTDCPQREKRGWMADAHVSSNAAALNFDMAALYENWLRTHADSAEVGCGPLEKNWTCPKWHNDQPGGAVAAVVAAVGGVQVGQQGAGGEVPNCYICCYGRPGFGCTPNTPNDTAGSIGDVIPFDKNGYGSFPGSIGWTSASFVIAGILLDTYAATAALADLYPGLSLHLHFYARNAAAHDPAGRGLVYWDQYGDWNGLESTSPLLMANAYFMFDAMAMASIALALGDTAEGLTWLALAGAINTALPQIYLSPAGVWDKGSQGAQAMGIAFALGPAASLANMTRTAGAALAANVAARGGHLSTGTLGSRWLLQALSLSGHGDVAVAMAATTSPPSVGAMVVGIPPHQPPLGTLWEGWDGPVASPGSSGNHMCVCPPYAPPPPPPPPPPRARAPALPAPRSPSFFLPPPSLFLPPPPRARAA